MRDTPARALIRSAARVTESGTLPPVTSPCRSTPANAGASFASLLHDVETKLFDALPDETWGYPGHGRDTTLGDGRPQIPEWRARGR